MDVKRHGMFVRLFSSAILMQALLSGSSLAVGLLLIRRTSDLEYGYFLLITNAVLLLTTLQRAYIYPSLVDRITRHDDAKARQNFVGGIYREQKSVLIWLIGALIAVYLVLWGAGVVSINILLLAVAASVASVCTLFREFFRMALLAYRRPNDVLRGDTLYVVILVAGAFVVSMFPSPAMLMALVLGGAAIAGGEILRRSMRAHEMWNEDGEKGVLKQIYVVGLWATAGAGVHWAFAYGYNYIVAGTLSISSVAAIGATRTLIMPVNLLSTGIGSFMFPTISSWLHQHNARTVLRRNALMAAGLVVVSSIYLVLVWLFRDWIFANVLKKQFAQRDSLLLLWFAVAIAMLLRDQLMYILVARQKFKTMSSLTLLSAIFSLSTSYIAMKHYGEVGALYGLLLGEAISVAGLVALSIKETSAMNSAVKHSI